MSISLVSPWYEPCVYRSLHFIISGKDAALDAAHSLKTDTDSKLYGMGVSLGESCSFIIQSFHYQLPLFFLTFEWECLNQVSAEQKKDKRTVEDIQVCNCNCISICDNLGQKIKFYRQSWEQRKGRSKSDGQGTTKWDQSYKMLKAQKQPSNITTLPSRDSLSCECLRSWSSDL